MKPRVISSLLAIFITQPIWMYLVYKILELVNASEVIMQRKGVSHV
jgi:hypothetical protein